MITPCQDVVGERFSGESTHNPILQLLRKSRVHYLTMKILQTPIKKNPDLHGPPLVPWEKWSRGIDLRETEGPELVFQKTDLTVGFGFQKTHLPVVSFFVL